MPSRQEAATAQRVLLLLLLVPALAAASTLDAVIPRVKNGTCGVDRSAGCYGPKRLRIGVLTLGTRDAHPISLISTFISAQYTEKHGYDFIVERCATTTVSNGSYMWDAEGEKKRQPQIVWSKSLALLKHLPHYNVLFFHDSDVFFVNHTYKIETFIDEFMVGNETRAEKSIAFGENCIDGCACVRACVAALRACVCGCVLACGCTHVRVDRSSSDANAPQLANWVHRPSPPAGGHYSSLTLLAVTDFCWNGFPGLNTGMIMVRNTPKSFEILADWAAAADDGRCAQHLFAHPREQNCFDMVVRHRHNEHLAVIDSMLWKGADGSWLVHLYSSGGGEPITVLAMRSFAYLLAQQHAHTYALLRNFTAEWSGVGEEEEGRVPPWREHLHCEGGNTGCAHPHSARRKRRQ
jgi:hypothetical protein